jgi:rhodanese-related sulfurtransferase
MSKPRRKHGFSGYILVLFTTIGLFVLLQEKDPGVKSVTAEEVSRLLSRDTAVVLLDVRNVEEWNSSTGHLRNAILIPLQDLYSQIKKLEAFRDRLIIVYCRSGSRGGKAARLLSDSGFRTVNLRGGMREWNAKKYPVFQEMIQ